MFKKVFSMALLFVATIMLLFPQQGKTEESLNKTSENNKLQVEITPPKDGFKVGTNNLNLTIIDTNGKSLTGANITITPWMPGMGHGVMLKPEVTEAGKGNYAATNVGFSMPGQWQLIVNVDSKDLDDKVIFGFANIGGDTVAKAGVNCNCGTQGNCPSGCLCGCQAGVTAAKCNMVDGKCQGNCSCGCKEGKPCQMKDGKCIGGCGCGCQAGAAAFTCPCGTGGNCPAGCGCGCQIGKAGACNCGTGGNCPAGCLCGCQAGKSAAKCPCGTGGNCPAGCGCGCKSAGVANCKCGTGCTNLVNCNCGPNCKCPKDGKGGCGCSVACKTGCGNGPCPLPKPLGT